jgi:two-component system NarL family sensor kinase
MHDPSQASLYIAIIITSITLGTTFIYFAATFIRQQKKNLELQRMNLLTEINTLEKERTRMAADLHDELGPTLSFIKFQVDSVEAADQDDQQVLTKASHHLDEALAKVRDIARNMMPSALVRKGLIIAMKEFIEGINETQSQLHIEFAPDINRTISQETSINLFRILQEVIQNTIRHSGASNAILQMTAEEKSFRILYEDNGKGFDYEARVNSQEGLGLRNFRSRIEVMGGKMSVASIIGKGTQYIFEIPLND